MEKVKSFHIALFITGVIIGLGFFHSADATPSLIGIQLSQNCLALIKAHMPTNCLTYDQLIRFDNSNQFLSGQFVSHPYFHRSTGHVLNQYQFYTKNTILVDPDINFAKAAQLIIVQSNNFTYVNKADAITNHTRVEYVNRFVDNCRTATVAPIISLINDTIKYFENGCTHTDYNAMQKVQMKETPLDFKNCAWCNYSIWLKKAETQHTQVCWIHKCADVETRWK